MRLKYWYAQCHNDSNAYSLRGRTKKEVVELLEQFDDKTKFGPIVKVEVEYKDAFDLLKQVAGEGGLHEEHAATYAANHPDSKDTEN